MCISYVVKYKEINASLQKLHCVVFLKTLSNVSCFKDMEHLNTAIKNTHMLTIYIYIERYIYREREDQTLIRDHNAPDIKCEI